MQRILIASAIAFVACTALTTTAPLLTDDTPLETFKINLDKAPKERFVEPTRRFASTILATLNNFESLLNQLLPEHLQVMIDYSFWYGHREAYLEMEGIAQVLSIDPRRIVVINFTYELIAFCTSLLGKQVDGTLIHVRLYDFLESESTKKILFIGEFYRNNTHIYSAVMNGGTPFFPTGFKNGSYSITLNQRNSLNRTFTEQLANIGMISYGHIQTIKLIRETLEACDDYQCAFNKLSNESIITRGYFIIAGVNGDDAAVISRDRQGAANVTFISEEHWYVVQTNDDHFDGICRERCVSAKANFELLGREAMTADTAFNQVLMVSPNLNINSIYGVKMVPKTGVFEVQRANGNYVPVDMHH